MMSGRWGRPAWSAGSQNDAMGPRADLRKAPFAAAATAVAEHTPVRSERHDVCVIRPSRCSRLPVTMPCRRRRRSHPSEPRHAICDPVALVQSGLIPRVDIRSNETPSCKPSMNAKRRNTLTPSASAASSRLP